MRKRKLDAQQTRIAASMTWAGVSAHAVAEEMRVSDSTLYRAFKREGVNWRPRAGAQWKKYTPERARELERLLETGMTVGAAAQVGIATSTAQRWQRMGICDLRGHMARGRRMGDDMYRRIYERYVDDKQTTPRELSRIYGVGYTGLMKAWQRLGLSVDEERTKAARRAGQNKAWARVDDMRLYDAYLAYSKPGSYIGAVKLKRTLNMSWDRIRREWRRMGLDVEKVTRAKFDREHGAGAYDRRFVHGAGASHAARALSE